MKKEYFRMGIGVSVIAVHAICFAIIFFGKDAYLSSAQKIDVALLFMPITAAYVVAIVRNAVDNATAAADSSKVNLNYALIALLITVITLLGLLWTVISLTGNDSSDRQQVVIFEIVFGAAFGLVAADLFGKVERVVVNPDDLKGK
ncbi:hypothetical protein [Mesorhizobium shangrilense]|uniref:Uncharacterized protein n=1 Tax=Mesorhizobium shangrilense TaxID=460060 RepID=A0ABV2D722_9HYPH